MLIDEKLLRHRIRERLYELGKSNPRKAVSGGMFTPRLLKEVRRQVQEEITGITNKIPFKDYFILGKEIQGYERRLNTKQVTSYGIPFEEFLRLVRLQKNMCAICFSPAISEKAKGRGRLSIDHNHETGLVRGLLCHACNTKLGKNIARTPAELHYLANPPAVVLLGTSYYGKT